MSNKNVTLKERITEIFKHSLIYGLTSSLQSLLGFVMLPILTAYYTPEMFGVYSILLLLSALSSAIFYFGASSALGRFFFDEDSDNYRNQIIATSFLVALVGALMLIIFGLCFSRNLSIYLFQSSKYSSSIFVVLIATAFGFLLNLMTLLLRYEKKSILFSVVIISGVLINFSISYLLLSKFHFGVLAPLYGLLVSNISCFFVLFIYRYKLLTLKLEYKYFKSILFFGIQSSIAGLFFYILEWVDRIIIKDLLSLEDVGIYSLGYRLGSIMNILVIMPFTLIWGPMRMQYAKNQDSALFTGKVISYYTVIGVLILIITIILGEDILKIFFTNESYFSSLAIMPIIMFSLFFYGYQGIVDFGIYLSNKVYYYIIVSFIAIGLNIALNYLFIPIYGYIASAYVTLFTYIFTSLSIYFISNIFHKIYIEIQRVLFALLVVPTLYYLLICFSIDNVIVKLAIIAIIFYLFYKYWLNKNERTLLIKKIRKMNLSRIIPHCNV